MSYEDGWAALNLEMPQRIPRTEYSVEMHWDLIKAVTGIDVGVESSPEVQARGARVRLLLAGKSDVRLMQLASRSLYRRLVQKGIAENLTAMEGGKRIIEFMREAKQAGVKFHACRPALPGYDVEPTDLIPEVDQVSSGGVLADMILSSDKVLFF